MYSATGGHLLRFKAVLYIKGSCYLLAYFSRDLQTFFNAMSNSSWNYRGCTCTLSIICLTTVCVQLWIKGH